MLITLHDNYNSSTLELQQVQPRPSTLHAAVEVTDQVTTATNATTPKKHSSNRLLFNQWIRSAVRD